MNRSIANRSQQASSSLLKETTLSPWRFEFFQLVHLLEQHYQLENGDDTLIRYNNENTEVGDFAPASNNKIRFKANPYLHFEPAPVKSVVQKGDAQSELTVNFWGLNGSAGVLPFHYSELIIQQLRNSDPSLSDFTDIFNHRSLSLFYKAWKKHRTWLKERSKEKSSSKFKKNWHEELLKGLTGLSTETDAAFNKTQGAWLNYAGFAASRVNAPSMLEQAIHHHFGLKVKIKQFKGQWENMPFDVRTRLSDRRSNGINNQLGASAILGERCWNVQNRFEVEIVDIEYDQFMTFAPGSQKLQDLYELIKFKVGTELDFDLTLKIKEKHLGVIPLHHNNKQTLSRAQLGWNTRLSHSSEHDISQSDNTIKVRISEYGMCHLARSATANTS